MTYTKAVKSCMLSEIKIIECSVKTLIKRSMIIPGFKIWKIIGPIYSIGKNGMSYFDG